jgi:hypothetical protein
VSHWSECVNQQLGSSGIADIHSYVRPCAATTDPPIDVFYRSLDELLKVGTPASITSDPVIGRLIVVGCVSATENYFRNVFSQILKICPTSRKRAAKQTVNFGSVLWHGAADLERGAFEGRAFSDPDTIVEYCQKFVGLEIAKASPLRFHLSHFATICELRHCIVHSDGLIQGNNATSLQMNPSNTRLAVAIGFAQVQEAAAICAGMVRAFNTEFFKLLSTRWAINWRQEPYWASTVEYAEFRKIWSIFYSKLDAVRGALSPHHSVVRCRNLVKREFNI